MHHRPVGAGVHPRGRGLIVSWQLFLTIAVAVIAVCSGAWLVCEAAARRRRSRRSAVGRKRHGLPEEEQ